MASSPTFPSPSHDSTSPPAGQHPALWPAHTQPLFSLANVISMAMTMAQSFIPPPATVAGYHPQYHPAPLEASYPTAGVPPQNSAYRGPGAAPQMEGLAPPTQPTWLQPGSAPSSPPQWVGGAEVLAEAPSEGLRWLSPDGTVSSLALRPHHNKL